MGAVGIVVPLLPTTPFWLLTCWFYLRSSPTLYNRFLSNKYVGHYLRNYIEEKAIPQKTKIYILTLLWVGSLFSVVLVKNIYITVILLVIDIAVTIHIFRIPTKQKKDNECGKY